MPSPEFTALVDQLFASPFPPEFPEMREAYLAMGDMLPLPAGVTVEKIQLGGCPCEWVSSAAPGRGTILMLHGGGYCIGGPGSHRHQAAEMALQTGARVALLDYRLAPEHPYPAGLNDALAAYLELSRAAENGPIALAGDSAGAGLAMALLARILSNGHPVPACVYCMSPWVDLTDRATSRTLKASVDPLASSALLDKMASAYAGDLDFADPLVSPVSANFRGAPPTYIQVGTAEVLMDDAINLAKTLADADVDVDLEIRAHMIHVWPWHFPMIPEGRDAIGRACGFITRHLSSAF
ncbi:acetyl esterase/lipase [Novosphingobium kunmingense]|uniref:Acetyl esterase/lipase n=1 Tax=Novosphingobium kunmingense TaxID=1211806 RepID=A0A2N0H2Y7_9SPHN|nr:alpha/beta hydrolase [Novosphingobium kunmingense]PKB13288.1 acetyl esterase/lipase [Novosphingobium kunmingense]